MKKRLGSVWAEIIQPFFRRPERVQVAALCYRTARAGKEVLLITSRDTGRWILPKGWPIDGMDAPHAAGQEAWEEAGVRGEVTPRALGQFSYTKGLETGGEVTCKTSVYPLKVTKLEDDFPEVSERERKWVKPEEAARMVQEPELKEMLAGF